MPFERAEEDNFLSGCVYNEDDPAFETITAERMMNYREEVRDSDDYGDIESAD